jgi:phage replication initiation protein
MKYPYPLHSDKPAVPAASAQHGGGAAAPRIVIRGESLISPPDTSETTPGNRVSFVDYLAFTCRYDAVDPAQIPLRNELIEIFGVPRYDWCCPQTGWNGYKHRAKLDSYGLVAWGGASQRNSVHVQLTGTACARVPDWNHVSEWATANQAKLTRVDLAHDDFDGRIVNFEAGVQWLEQGLFVGQGRPPAPLIIDDCGSNRGKTIYVGNRKSGKLIRIYEKGKQLGDTESRWCRAEVEFRRKDRQLVWDMVLHPDHYLAGSCTAFSFLSAEQSRVATIARTQGITLERAIDHCRIGYGQLVNVIYLTNGKNAEAVVKALSRDGVPKKMKAYYEGRL